MPEPRARQHQRGRMIEALKEEISTIIEGDLGDPRIALCTVNEIVMNVGGKSARVFLQVQGNAQEMEDTLKAINAAKGYIRHELLERLGKRHVPDLVFTLDRSDEFGNRIETLLGRIKKRKK